MEQKEQFIAKLLREQHEVQAKALEAAEAFAKKELFADTERKPRGPEPEEVNNMEVTCTISHRIETNPNHGYTTVA